MITYHIIDHEDFITDESLDCEPWFLGIISDGRKYGITDANTKQSIAAIPTHQARYGIPNDNLSQTILNNTTSLSLTCGFATTPSASTVTTAYISLCPGFMIWLSYLKIAFSVLSNLLFLYAHKCGAFLFSWMEKLAGMDAGYDILTSYHTDSSRPCIRYIRWPIFKGRVSLSSSSPIFNTLMSRLFSSWREWQQMQKVKRYNTLHHSR